MIENCSSDHHKSMVKYCNPPAAPAVDAVPAIKLSTLTKGTGKKTKSLYTASNHRVIRIFCLITFERHISLSVLSADLMMYIREEIESRICRSLDTYYLCYATTCCFDLLFS